MIRALIITFSLSLAALFAGSRSQPTLQPRTGEESVKLFLFFGQSNMTGPSYSVAGYASVPANPIGHRLNTFVYWAQNAVQDTEQGFTSKEAMWDSAYDNNGPEVAFAAKLIEDGYYGKIYIAKYTANGTSLADDWIPNNYGIRDAAPALANNALAQLRGWNSNVEVAGIFWCQGAGDAKDSADAAGYEANLETLIADWESGIDGGIDVPVIIIESPGWPFSADNTAGRAYGDEVRAAQAAFAAAQSDRIIIETGTATVGPDNTHWTAQAIDDVGAATAAGWITNFE